MGYLVFSFLCYGGILSDYYQNVGLRAFAIFCVFIQVFGFIKLTQKIYTIWQLANYPFVGFLIFNFLLATFLFMVVIYSIRQSNERDLRLAVFLSFVTSCLLWGAVFTP